MERRKFVISAMAATASLPVLNALGGNKTTDENINVKPDLLLFDQATDYELDIKNFPEDKVELPAQLENMRPGQVRYAIKQSAPCLIPVGNIQSGSDNESVGWNEAIMDSLNSLHQSKSAVIAPVIWYTPTGYILNSAENGTFDMSMDAFTLYLEEVMINMVNLGFKDIHIVVLNNPQGKNSPLFACARFVVANMYNNLWKRSAYGKCWYINPKFDGITNEHGIIDRREVFNIYSVINIERLPKVTKNKGLPGSKPMRLENMTPTQIKDAVKRNLICFVPSGVIETHGNHNPLGVDGIESEGPLLLACAKADAVIAPTIWYGPTGITCGDETVGNTNIDGNIYRNYISGVLNGLTAIGFKTIVVIQVHQGKDGPQWVSTEYAIQDYHINFYKNDSKGKFGLPADIKIMTPPFAQYDHAGKIETSWMMYYRPKNTDLSLIRPNDYSCCWRVNGESIKATYEYGKIMSDKAVDGLVEMINLHNNIKE